MENEHHHSHTHSHSKELTLPMSVLLASIILAGGMLGASALMAQNLKTVLGTVGKTNTITLPTNPSQPSQPSAVPTAPGGVVKVEARKDAPTMGKGKVEIVEFSDFQCPFCQKFFNDAYKQIKAKYVDTGKAKLVFRHYPLSFHQNAQKAGEAAECANRQGKFWPYHDVLFQKAQADGKGLEVESLKQYAKDLGLNSDKFNACLDNGETASIVSSDTTAGNNAGVSGTPTVFINGQKVVGAQPFSAFESIIESALK
jgi:protein-disulfide isomerase